MDRRGRFTPAFAAVAWILLGPAMTVSAASGEAEEKTSAEAVEQEVEEALHAIRDYSAEQRDQALTKARKALNELDARIDDMEQDLREGWSDLDRAARKQTRETLRGLREQRNEIAEWYGGMKHGSREAWDRMKTGFLESWDRLEEAFLEAREEIASEETTKEKE